MKTEQAVITQVKAQGIVVEDDYGDPIHINSYFVVGESRVGATVTLVCSNDRIRAFVEPAEPVARIASEPDESGVQMIGRHISEILKAV